MQLRSRKLMAPGEDSHALGVSSGRSSSPGGGRAMLSWAARGCALTALVVISVWVHQLGGLSSGPERGPDGAVTSTDKLFNWHPLLMTLAFAVFMGDAVLQYKAPWQEYARPVRKQVHYLLHSAAVLSALLGFIAAWKSHTLKEPPIPNLYSPHSYIGLTALLMLVGQYGIGFASYLYPTIALEQRVALGPLHRFWGLATYGTGMAAVLVGLQEKATFLQAFGKKGVYSSYIRLPALTELLVVGAVLLVLLHYYPLAPGRRQAVAYTPVLQQHDEEGGATGGGAGGSGAGGSLN